MTGRLAGKIALITGVGGGMGVAAARCSAPREPRSSGATSTQDGAARTEEAVRAEGGEITVMGGVDLGDPDAARAWVDAAVATYDGIDVLYNNASTQRFGALDELSVEDWDFTMRNELDLVYYTVRAAWPHLKAYGGGSIINVGSIAALRGVEFMPQNAHSDGQGRRDRADPAAGRRGRPARHPRQRDQPRHDRDPQHRADAGRPAGADEADRPRPDPARPGRPARGRRQRRDLPGLRRVLVDQRDQHRGRRLGVQGALCRVLVATDQLAQVVLLTGLDLGCPCLDEARTAKPTTATTATARAANPAASAQVNACIAAIEYITSPPWRDPSRVHAGQGLGGSRHRWAVRCTSKGVTS